MKTATKPKLVPIGERVVLVRDVDADKTEGGIVIPNAAKEKKYQGRVTAVGEGEKVVKALQVGDVVIFGTYAGTEIEVDGDAMLIVGLEEVLARYDDGKVRDSSTKFRKPAGA